MPKPRLSSNLCRLAFTLERRLLYLQKSWVQVCTVHSVPSRCTDGFDLSLSGVSKSKDCSLPHRLGSVVNFLNYCTTQLERGMSQTSPWKSFIQNCLQIYCNVFLNKRTALRSLNITANQFNNLHLLIEPDTALCFPCAHMYSTSGGWGKFFADLSARHA